MLISFNERYLEKALVDKWVDENEADLLLTPNELQEFINSPPQLCDVPSSCVSRYLSGNGCMCIRSVFKNQKQFNQWKNAFEKEVKEKLFVGIDITEIKN